MTRYFTDSNRLLSVTGFFLPLKLLCGSHFLLFRTQYFLTGFIDLVKCVLFAVSVPFYLWTPMDWIRTNNNCVPYEKAAVKTPDRIYFLSALPDWATIGNWKCRIRTAPLRPRRSVLLFTPHSHQQPQRESNPCFRSDSPAYSPLYYEAMFWRAGSAGKQKGRLSDWTSGSLSNSYWNLFGHHTAPSEAPGPKHPLDPVILRHTQISHSVSLTVGIIVPWRSNMQFVFLFVLFCSIAFPFRTSCPFFYAYYITCVLVCHSTCGINLSRGLSQCHPMSPCVSSIITYVTNSKNPVRCD